MRMHRVMSTEARRTGRRPGDARSRELILDAARESFGAGGYDGTTIRGVATGPAWTRPWCTTSSAPRTGSSPR